MTLQQLHYIREIIACGFSVSRAATALHTSQPSMSRQVQALERELGFQVFTRSKRRILGLTVPGNEVAEVARKVISATEGLRHVGTDFFARDTGSLVVTTSHTHARYVLPKVIQAFTRKYPKVRVTLRQGNPTQVAQWLSSGQADLSICSMPTREVAGLVLLPCYDQHKIVLVPAAHPLARSKRRLTIEALAAWPLITYDTDFTTHSQVMRAFADAGCRPNVILSATDVDVMKAYVKCDLGIAIVAGLSYDPGEDRGLRALEARHLFESNKIYIGMREHAYLRQFAFDFLNLFFPQVTREQIKQALAGT